MEVGGCGFEATSTLPLLSESGVRGQKLRHTVGNISMAAERASEWLWLHGVLLAKFGLFGEGSPS